MQSARLPLTTVWGGSLRAAKAARLCLSQSRFYASRHESELSTPDRGTVASKVKKELKTDFTVMLQQRINLSSFVPLSEFMKEALLHPDLGYYTTKRSVIGGEKSDFITAAEIPFFGDILAGWIVDMWQKMGTPRRIHLVELGPGKGTLMKNMMRQIKHMAPQLTNFLRIHMVEMGAERIKEQKEALKDFQTADGRISWHMTFDAIPFTREPTIIIANEFFDALPVSRFQYTDRGWLETLVDIDDNPENVAHFKYAHSPAHTWSSIMIPEDVKERRAEDGDAVEICSHGMAMAEKIARRVVDGGNAVCLIIDYGKDEHMRDTLRGIRGHKFVDPLLSPGDVDLSAWVSFKQLRWAINRMEDVQDKIKVHPLITQRQFLEDNGIDIRLASAIKDQETRLAMRLLQHHRRLVDEDEMGKAFKMFCFQSTSIPNAAPWY